MYANTLRNMQLDKWPAPQDNPCNAHNPALLDGLEALELSQEMCECLLDYGKREFLTRPGLRFKGDQAWIQELRHDAGAARN